MAVATALLLFASPAHAIIMQADDQFTCVANGGDVSPFLRSHHATVLRLIVPYRGHSNAVACASRAAAQGYRVYVSLQYSNAWRPAKVAAYFRRTLPLYSPYAWAVSVGNEQDLVQGAHATGRKYRAVWNAVEPILARTAPQAIRVYGETSPFGFRFLLESFQPRRPRGAQAIAFHCYDVKNGGLSVVPQVAKWAAGKHLPPVVLGDEQLTPTLAAPVAEAGLAVALERAGGCDEGPLAQPEDGQLLPLAGDRRPVARPGGRCRAEAG
ncbi:MAG TPA: hypothetical protein VJ741_21215 [Solirubrobacteraceae bacterium]|nr:hypothetical protein [Solirubrobacteraceae bacterium]